MQILDEGVVETSETYRTRLVSIDGKLEDPENAVESRLLSD